MKDYKKLRKSFIMVLIFGAILLTEGIVMKLVLHNDSFFLYSLIVGAVLAVVGAVGTVITTLKAKKQQENGELTQAEQAAAEAQTVKAEQTMSEQSMSEQSMTEQAAPESSARVGNTVQLVDGDKWRIKTFIILTALYAVVLLAGVIGYFTGFGIKDADGVAICKAICLAYAFITPSYFLYFGFGNPFHLPKAVSVGIAVFGIIAMVVCFILGFVTISNLPEVESGFWSFVLNIFIYLAIACAVVGYGVIYGVICRGAVSVWYLGCGVGFTLLFPVVAALIAAIFVLSFIIGAIKWILSCLGIMTKDTSFGFGFIAGFTGKVVQKNQYTYTDQYGYSHTVFSDNGTDFYNVDGSYAGHSDDGGRHIS